MIKTRTTKITWKSIEDKLATNCRSEYENYLIENYGFERMNLIGRIGYGGKTHRFAVVAKFEDGVYEIAGVDSYCGSAKWQSNLCIVSDNAEVTCKKCNY